MVDISLFISLLNKSKLDARTFHWLEEMIFAYKHLKCNTYSFFCLIAGQGEISNNGDQMFTNFDKDSIPSPF